MASADGTVVVTGGASGMGEAMVVRFASAGHRVVAADIDRQRVEELAARVAGVVPVVADVSTPAGVDAIVEGAGDAVSVLCNNAGVHDSLKAADEVTLELWEKVFAINLTGPYMLCNRLIPIMIAGGGGSIINIASVAGIRGGRAGAAYTSSKYGLVGLSQNIAWSYRTDGIRCNVICPGRISTRIRDGAEFSAQGAGRLLPQRPSDDPVGEQEQGAALGAYFSADYYPVGEPEQVAALAAYLASDAASFINGAVLTADGGLSAY